MKDFDVEVRSAKFVLGGKEYEVKELNRKQMSKLKKMLDEYSSKRDADEVDGDEVYEQLEFVTNESKGAFDQYGMPTVSKVLEYVIGEVLYTSKEDEAELKEEGKPLENSEK